MQQEEKKAEIVTIPDTTVILSEDFDETLNRSDGTVDPNCLHAIRKAKELEIPVWIVTARDMCTTMRNVSASIRVLRGQSYETHLMEDKTNLDEFFPSPGIFCVKKKDGYFEYVVTNLEGITYRHKISVTAPELQSIQLEPFDSQKVREISPILSEIASKKGHILAGKALILEAIRINRISRALQDVEDEFLPRPKVYTDLDASLPMDQQGEYYKKLEKIMDFFEKRAIKLAESRSELSTGELEKILSKEIEDFVEYMQYFTCWSANYKLILVKELDEETINSLTLSGTGFILSNDDQALVFVNGKLIESVSVNSSKSVPVKVPIASREDIELAAEFPLERKSGPETDQMISTISTKFLGRRIPIPIPKPLDFAMPNFLKEDPEIAQLVTEETELLTKRSASGQKVDHGKNHQFAGIAKKLDQESKTSTIGKRTVFFHLDDSKGVNQTLGKKDMKDFTLKPYVLAGQEIQKDAKVTVFPVPYTQEEEKQTLADQALLAVTKGMIHASKHADKIPELDNISTIISQAIKSLEIYRDLRLERANTCGGSLTFNYGFFGYSGKEKRESAWKLVNNLTMLMKNLNGEKAGELFSFSPREKDALFQSGSDLRKTMEGIDLKGLREKYKIFHPHCKNFQFLDDLVNHFTRLAAHERSMQMEGLTLY